VFIPKDLRTMILCWWNEVLTFQIRGLKEGLNEFIPVNNWMEP